jgi:hypothetical protein
MTLAATSAPARRRGRLWWLWALLLLVALTTLATLAWLVRGERWSAAGSRTPMELVRYAERRLIGHPKLESVFGPALRAVRRTEENEPPPGLPRLGKGQQPFALTFGGFDAQGRPIAALQPRPAVPAAATRTVNTVTQLFDAVVQAGPGHVLELAPGRYELSRTLQTGRAGEPARPVRLRAAHPGSVELVVSAVEGIRVTQPHWVFENLNWRGTCAEHEQCEHAFHVVGAGRGTVILNNRLVDFNAAVKINGENGDWPDDGLLQFTTLSNSSARRTDRPVSAIDLVGAHGWQIADNHLERSIKAGGDSTSYAMCIKGASQHTRIERNLVVCSPERISQRGLRVGVSLGCGGTRREFCRDGRCEFEQLNSTVANNVVAHCNDFGIDLHRTGSALVAHNTLVNTEGIDARHGSTQATVVGNLIEGRARARDGARLIEQDNVRAGTLDRWLAEPHALDLRWLTMTDGARATPETERDFCGARRPPMSPPGATVETSCGAASAPVPR